MVRTMTSNFKAFDSPADMQQAACDYIAGRLKHTLGSQDKANIVLSGGSSPRPIYEALSHMDLAWERVTCGLVDERWVRPDEAGSNAAFIHNTLLQNKAAKANFVPMKTDHRTAEQGAKTISKSYGQNFNPLDICVMGMGLDGHTASWFPKAVDLNKALDINNRDAACAFDAKGCPVAGDHTERMTLTLPAVMLAKEIILLISGDEKRAVFDAAAKKSVYDAPVKALLGAGPRLKIFWGA